MPKKRATKGEKPSGMTEEERLVYMQQKAQAEREMANRKEDMHYQFLKEKLQNEERNSAVNRRKVTEQWRAILRQTRSAELRTDIDVLRQTFERVIDLKDSVIKCLVGDLTEAEQQSAQVKRSHLQCLDSLMALQKARLDSLEQQWNTSLEELSSEFNSEREQILFQHQRECANLKDVTFVMEQNYTKVDSETHMNYQSTMNEIKNKNIEEKDALKTQMEKKDKTLRRQYEQTQSNYIEATERRHIACNTPMTRDQKSHQEIATNTRRLQKIQGERVLRLGEMCRKLEPEHEKVLPFTSKEESKEQATVMEPPSEELAQENRNRRDKQ